MLQILITELLRAMPDKLLGRIPPVRIRLLEGV